MTATINLTDFHEWLRGCTPCRDGDIVSEMEIMHACLPDACKGFPKGPAEVSAAMRELEARGMVKKVNGEWRWLDGERVKEPQGVLFS